MSRLLLAFLLLFSTFAAPSVHAQGTPSNTITDVRVQNGVVTVEFEGNPGAYYLLEQSPDLRTWGPADMSLGIPSNLDITPGVTRSFFRAIPFSKYSPQDTDGDGIDELNNSELMAGDRRPLFRRGEPISLSFRKRFRQATSHPMPMQNIHYPPRIITTTRVSNDRRQSHQLIISAGEAQVDGQRRNERNEAYHKGDMQAEQIDSYRRPIQRIRSGLNDVIGITNMFR